MQTKHWNSRSVRLTGTRSTARCRAVDCSALTLCRALGLARTPDLAELRHTTPVRACISFALSSYPAFSGALPTSALTAPSRSLETWRIYGRIRLSISSVLGDLLVILSSFLQRKTRQTIYIIVIDTCSLRLKICHYKKGEIVLSRHCGRA